MVGRVHLQGYEWRLSAKSAERAGGQEASTRGQGCHVLMASCNCTPEQWERGSESRPAGILTSKEVAK